MCVVLERRISKGGFPTYLRSLGKTPDKTAFIPTFKLCGGITLANGVRSIICKPSTDFDKNDVEFSVQFLLDFSVEFNCVVSVLE